MPPGRTFPSSNLKIPNQCAIANPLILPGTEIHISCQQASLSRPLPTKRARCARRLIREKRSFLATASEPSIRCRVGTVNNVPMKKKQPLDQFTSSFFVLPIAASDVSTTSRIVTPPPLPSTLTLSTYPSPPAAADRLQGSVPVPCTGYSVSGCKYKCACNATHKIGIDPSE